MRRMVVFILVVFVAAMPLAWPASAQNDDAEATVAALQTRVAELEGTEVEDGDAVPSAVPTSTPSPALPDGIPAASIPAEVADHIDGDKIRVRIGDATEEILLIGVDAPETDEGPLGECYAKEASNRLRKMLPKGRSVYLEQERDQDDRDSKDRLLRYMWFIGQEDDKAYLVNEIMLREGFGGYEPRELSRSR